MQTDFNRRKDFELAKSLERVGKERLQAYMFNLFQVDGVPQELRLHVESRVQVAQAWHSLFDTMSRTHSRVQ